MKKFQDIPLEFAPPISAAEAAERDQKYRCSKCYDSGVVIDAEGVAHPCSCYLERRRANLQQRSGMPVGLRDKRFANFQLRHYSPNRQDSDGYSYEDLARQALRNSSNFVKEIVAGKQPKGLCFSGTVGSGKTHLAAAIGNELLANGHEVLFLVVPEFLDDLRATYGSTGEFCESELMSHAQNAEVLILDDLGAHNFTEWTKNKIFSLVNYRCNRLLPMIVTTNHKFSVLADTLGTRTVSRLMECCKITNLETDADIRLVKSMEEEK